MPAYGRLKPRYWVIFRQDYLECDMVRMHAKSRPAFVPQDWVPSLPIIGIFILLTLASMLIYQLARPGRAHNGSSETSTGNETISIAPPSFVLEGDNQGQIHFESDPRW